MVWNIDFSLHLQRSLLFFSFRRSLVGTNSAFEVIGRGHLFVLPPKMIQKVLGIRSGCLKSVVLLLGIVVAVVSAWKNPRNQPSGIASGWTKSRLHASTISRTINAASSGNSLWTPSSWQKYPIKQPPNYSDQVYLPQRPLRSVYYKRLCILFIECRKQCNE